MLAQNRPQSLYRPQKRPDQENVLKLLILFWWLADRGTLTLVSNRSSTRDRVDFAALCLARSRVRLLDYLTHPDILCLLARSGLAHGLQRVTGNV